MLHTGTSTNLVVSGLQAQRYRLNPEKAAFSFFEITPYGEFVAS